MHSNPITGKAFGQAITQLAHELDLVGLILLTSGWLFILLPLTLVSHGSSTTSGMYQRGPPQILRALSHEIALRTLLPGAIEYALATGGILLMVFTWWETKASNPIMPYQFLLNRGVVCVCVSCHAERLTFRRASLIIALLAL